MKALTIGKLADGRRNFNVPADIVTESLAIFGIKGAGKSSTTRVIVEELVKLLLPVVVFDPKGDWWGITSNAKGNGEGLPFRILGGDHGHVPLEYTGGALVADFVIDNPAFYILDLSDMRKGQQRRFFTDFAERLYWRKRRERDALMVVVDESDLFAPQSTFGTDDRDYSPARMVGAAEDLVRRGRQRGIGSMWPTQRPASLHTGVRTQCSTLIALRMSGSHDLKAIDDWVNANGTDEQRKVMMAALASQDTGVGFVWSPHFLKCFEQVQFRMMETFDSFATPKAGARLVEPKVQAKVDLSALSSAMKETIEKAQENDPKLLKAELARLRRELADRPAEVEVREVEIIKEIRTEVPVPYIPEVVKEFVSDLAKVEEMVGAVGRKLDNVITNVGTDPGETKVTEEIRDFPRESRPTKTYERADTTTRPPLAPRPPRPVSEGEAKLGKAERAIIAVLAQFGTRNRNQLAFLAGYHSNSKGFANSCSALRTAGLITQGPQISLTSEGQALAEQMDVEPLPTGRALLEHFKGLGKVDGAGRKILDALYEHSKVSRVELAEICGYHPNSKGFANSLSRMRSLGFVVGSGELEFSPDLQEALR